MKRSSFERSTLSALPDKYVSESSILSSSSAQLSDDYDDDDARGGGVFSDASLTSVEQLQHSRYPSQTVNPSSSGADSGIASKPKKSRFRSLRLKSLLLLTGKKKKPTTTTSEGSTIVQSAESQSSVATLAPHSAISAAASVTDESSAKGGKSRHEGLLKKFASMRKSRKQRKADAIKRHTPEGANLSQSEKSLVNRYQQQPQHQLRQHQSADELERTSQSEPSASSSGTTVVAGAAAATATPSSATTILEKGDQLQIVTRSMQKSNEPFLSGGGGSDGGGQQSAAAVSFDTNSGAAAVSHSQSTSADCRADQLPLDRAPAVPYNISEVEISKLLVATGGSAQPHAHPHSASKGAIKKTVTTTTQHRTRRDFYARPANVPPTSEPAVMQRTGSIERGRRYPRPASAADEPAGIAVVQHLVNEAAATGQPGAGGNSVENPNLSGSIASEATGSVGGTVEATEEAAAGKSSTSGSAKSDVRVGSKRQQQQQQQPLPKMSSIESTGKREHLYKILVIGELGTGKTSFIKRYVHQFFSQNYRATIGVDFALKVLNWDPSTIIRLQLWDIAGQERFGNMTRVYYKEAVGAFIVFDVTRSATFDAVVKWKQDLDSKVQLPNGNPIPCILLANKCDQPKQGAVSNAQKMDEYVKENGFAGWFETSAKENVNIEESARALVNKILLNDKLINADDVVDADKFGLNTSPAPSTKNKCSC